ncbi:MAG: hypothetical protein JXD18_04065 [Anaerolineae bacterium]|nr:hypothetical protein [Anaerolineae bacterium]
MAEEQIEKIELALEELFDGISEGEDLCASFEIPGSEEWVQLTARELNIFWPYDEEDLHDLEEEMKDIFSRCKLTEFEEGVSATFEIELLELEDMADIVDWVFTEVLEVAEDYQLDIDVFEY